MTVLMVLVNYCKSIATNSRGFIRSRQPANSAWVLIKLSPPTFTINYTILRVSLSWHFNLSQFFETTRISRNLVLLFWTLD